MKQALKILTLLSLFALSAQIAFAQTPLRVAVYEDEGTGTSRLAVMEALGDTTQFEIVSVLGADIRAGVLQDIDVLIHPGGSGSGQAESLMEAGRDSVCAFVRRGGGVLGICAGSYLFSSDYTWSLNLLNTQVVDKAHWNRGGGQADVHFSNWGKDFFGFAEDTVMIEYRQGALMAPALVDTLPGYIEAGTFQTEFTENGAPEGVMIGTSAFAFSRYHEGRVAAFSPHPEITTGREHMIADAVLWVASNDPYLGIASPRNCKPLEAGSVTRIEWVAEDMDDPVVIEFSPDDGLTWETIASGLVEPLIWTVPETPAESCLLTVTSLTDGSLTDTVHLSVIPAPLSILSVQTGNWSDPATWEDGIIPGSTDNVVIGSGHIVTVDAAASCCDLSFVDGSGRLAMQADLSLYGDFNRYGTSDNPFYSGSNLWVAGAKMIFTGSAEVQAITGLGTTSSSPYPLRFQEIVVDKPAGKLTTNPVDGTEVGYRLGIGTSLEIISGTFELAARDDIEGRSTWGSATTPTITVGAGGVFRMRGSYSHIRRGNFTGSDSSKIGKLTVHGDAYLACATSNRLNLGDIDIEDGGTVTIPYYSAGGSMGTGRFNPGTITVKAGGAFAHQLINDIWYDNTTTPNQIALLADGTVTSSASAPKYPAFSVNEGTVVYARNSSGQTVFGMDYHNLALSGAGGTTLSSDVTVTGTCAVTGAACLTDAYSLYLAPTAALAEGPGTTVVGTVIAERTVDLATLETFGGIGLEILANGSAPGLTQVVRTTGGAGETSAQEGIARRFAITPENNSGLGASVLFRYDESELGDIIEGALTLFAGGDETWTQLASSRNIEANIVESVDPLDGLTGLTLGQDGVVAAAVQSVTVETLESAIDISWRMMMSIPVENLAVFRLEGGDRDRVALAGTIYTEDNRTFRYIDESAEPGTDCCYQIELSDGATSQIVCETASITVPMRAFGLEQNFPNPFNPQTVIDYSLPKSGRVSLDIYDVAGHRVSRLVDAVQSAGKQSVTWTGVDQRGNPVASGTYFYRLVSEDQTLVKKMLLVR